MGFDMSDGSGDLRVDDAGYDAIDAGLVALGNQLQLTGALDYSFSNFKVQPREAGDALLLGCTWRIELQLVGFH